MITFNNIFIWYIDVLYLTLNAHMISSSSRSTQIEIERTSLMNRIGAHDFCGDNNEFALTNDETTKLAINESFFLSCKSLQEEWIECEDVALAKVQNGTKMEFLCPYFGDLKGPLLYANVTCRALPCIECHGPRSFVRRLPCKKYTGHYFLTALLYSIFLGLFAVDRFYLGYSAIAVGKLMTLGGLGVWWIVDVFLLLNGQLRPSDDSEWQPFIT